MRTKLHIVLFFAVFISCFYGCKKNTVPSYKGYELTGQQAPLDMVFIPGDGKIPSFYIGRSEEPNINYVAYLSWVKNTFIDYPEVYEDAKIRFNSGGSVTRFNDPTLVYHMEHPAFAYYPIVGATWNQIQNYLVWKTDRLNEDILIQNDFTEEDFNQMNEENFNTESFIYGQYMGRRNKPMYVDKRKKTTRSIAWDDGILFAGFRLPNEAEWELLKNEENNQVVQSSYPYGENYPFLRWLRPTYDGYYSLEGISDYHHFWKNQNSNKKIDLTHYQNGIQGPYISQKPSNVAGNVKEWLMDVYHDTAITDWESLPEYFYKIGFETRAEKQRGIYDQDGIIDLKDSLGRLKFRILGINSDGSPLWSLHPRNGSTIRVAGYDTTRQYIDTANFYFETEFDSFYKRFKKTLTKVYFFYKSQTTDDNNPYNYYNGLVENPNMLILKPYLVNYNYQKPLLEIPPEHDFEAINRETYFWVKKAWDTHLGNQYCCVSLINMSRFQCNDTGIYYETLTPKYEQVTNEDHQQYKLIRGGTWESPNFKNREFMLADSGSSDVGFRVLLPYTNMPVKEKYKVKWK